MSMKMVQNHVLNLNSIMRKDKTKTMMQVNSHRDIPRICLCNWHITYIPIKWTVVKIISGCPIHASQNRK